MHLLVKIRRNFCLDPRPGSGPTPTGQNLSSSVDHLGLITSDSVEEVAGVQLVVLHDQVLHFFAHAWTGGETISSRSRPTTRL